MKITTLVENTSVSSKYEATHGLSFYIETMNHKILFDLGPNELFLKNAEKLGIDIALVDTVIISHGHSDHGGGLATFLENNKSAKVYVHETAFDKYYTKTFDDPCYAGIDSSIKNHPQIILTGDNCIIDTELQLYSKVTDRECYSLLNNNLFVKTDKGLEYDNFIHEQNLIISENGNYTLLAGCAHCGIINVQKKAEKIIGHELAFLIGGFHLFNPISKECESTAFVKNIADKLKTRNTKYYTCHCTGEEAFAVLKDILDDKIDYLAVGSSILL